MNKHDELMTAILVVIILVLVWVVLFFPCIDPVNVSNNDELLKKEIENKRLKEEYSKLDSLRVKQSSKIDSLGLQLELGKIKYNKIKSEYEKKRIVFANMSDDEHIEFISTAISKEDSVR